MITDLRVFTPEGNEEFSKLFELDKGAIPSAAAKLASDIELTETFVSMLETPIPVRRLDLATSLWPYLGPGGAHEIKSSSPLFWNWLAARLMSEAISASGGKVGAKSRWYYTEGSRSAYRHLLSSAFGTYQAHHKDPDSAMSILCQPIGVPGEVVEQILATRSIAGSIGAQLATALYFNSSTGLNKLGSGGAGPGSPRRLAAFLNQIRLTVDHKSMSVPQILDLLPREFDKFK
jgi:hypothetical protein